MSEDLCIPSRTNTLTGNYSAEYKARMIAWYIEQAEPQAATDNPIARYFRPVVEAPAIALSPKVRKVCASVKMAWTVNRPQPVPILAVGWPVGAMVEDRA